MSAKSKVIKCTNQTCPAYRWKMNSIEVKNHCIAYSDVSQCEKVKIKPETKSKPKWVPKPGELIYVWDYGCDSGKIPRYLHSFNHYLKGLCYCYADGKKKEALFFGKITLKSQMIKWKKQ